MGFPEELPDDWPIPEDIAGPTGSPFTNLIVQMLTSGMLGNDGCVLVGELVAEDARFNIWFGTEGKRILSMREMAECSLLHSDSLKTVYEPWREYSRVHEAAGRMAGSADAEHEALVAGLRAAIDMLRTVRANHSPEREG